MRFFFGSQAIIYLLLICPTPYAFRLVLGGFWLAFARKRPFAALLGAIWQVFSLCPGLLLGHHPWSELGASSLGLRCDARFWFVCSSDQPNLFVNYLFTTKIGAFAWVLRDELEIRCLAWNPYWGKLAFSLILGAAPDDQLKGLYRNLGFLHVLVISGTQFALLARFFRFLILRPLAALYAFNLFDWRFFRPLRFFAEVLCMTGLLIYLLACGASPPCQRAFLEQIARSISLWCSGQGHKASRNRVFCAQMLLFPQQWFSLSNLLTWGAVYAVQAFGRARTWSSQLHSSLCIQLMNLAIFGRISLASLLFDFLISPAWDLLLAVCLLGIFVPSLGLQGLLSTGLDAFHDFLWRMDILQTMIFGSSALALQKSYDEAGRLIAALTFTWVILDKSSRRRS